ncbi:GumC family protein [Massilibacteroides vaginae]|uniref:GumC family protein n=1 Tax=Massilibacteroides vaginae TaxID=1673718 RepID=UPI001FEC319D|nr:tyrosine protein kinase [Massilibacteroides vaginae]
MILENNMNQQNVDKEVINLKRIIINYLHHWKLFLVSFLISSVFAILYLVLYPTTFEIIASVQLQEDQSVGPASIGMGEASGLMKSFGLGSIGSGAINMDDELAKFLSVDMMEKMILELGVNVKFLKPWAYKHYMYSDVPITLVPDSATNKTLRTYVDFDIDIKKDGSVVVKTEADKVRNRFDFSALPATVDLAQGRFTIGYKTDAVFPYSVAVQVQPAIWMAEGLIEDFLIEEYSKTSKVIEITYRDHEKIRGENMINTLISVYNDQERDFKIESGNTSLVFLDGRIVSIMDELSLLEIKIEQYKTKNKMTNIEADILFYVEQMKELQIKIIEAETQYRLIELMANYINDPMNANKLIPALVSTSEKGESNPITIYNEALLERERLMQTSEEENPLLNSINTRISQLRQSVFLSIENTRKGVKMLIDDLKYKENAILSKMGDVPLLEREYLDYRRQQEILQGMYLILLQKREEVQFSVGDVQDKARVINAAYVKENPVAPRKLFAVLGIFFFTIIVPIGFLFAKEQIVDFVKEYKGETNK